MHGGRFAAASHLELFVDRMQLLLGLEAAWASGERIDEVVIVDPFDAIVARCTYLFDSTHLLDFEIADAFNPSAPPFSRRHRIVCSRRRVG
jgi:hypothetical protein